MRDRTRMKKKSWTRIHFRRRQQAPYCEHIHANAKFAWTPELFGPVFANDKISLQKALDTHLTGRRTRMMATFVPDELIYAIDLTKKTFREFAAVLLLVDMSYFNSLWERFSCAINNGSNGFSSILNFYMSLMVENIYSSDGDIIQVSAEEIVAMWKVRKDEFMTKTIETVIKRALQLKDIMADFGIGSKSFKKAKMAISSGLVIFSVIGNENGRDFVIVGDPIVKIRKAKENCAPGDLIVTESAWEHVCPKCYEYVFRDAYNVKVFRSLEHSSKSRGNPGTDASLAGDKFPVAFQRNPTPNSNITKKEVLTAVNKNSTVHKLNQPMEESRLGRKIFTGRFSVAEAARRKLGIHLKSFTIKPVLRQIEKDFPLEHLTETRRATVTVVNLEPINSSVYELLTLIDGSYIVVHSIVSDHFGCLNALTIHDGAIQFSMVFGLGPKTHDYCKNGIICAAKCIRALERIPVIRGASVGISTGMIYCGVIGHSSRMNYVTFGSPVEKANKIAYISSNKICCDFDTVFYSRFPRKKFRYRGMKKLEGSGMSRLYQFMDDRSILCRGTGEEPEQVENLDYVYPILGRSQDLDIFTDILDDICASNRIHFGFLIEGPGRTGKSRLLDELVRIVESRQISVWKLCLDESNAIKPYSTIFLLLMQVLEAEDGETIEERERALTRKLCGDVPLEDFCYMNIVSRVAFPLSKNYISESEKTRVTKSLIIFDVILRSLRGPKCIILDDVHFVDSISWQFISRLMNNNKLLLVMSMQPTVSHVEFPKLNDLIANDKRIFRHKLQGLEPGYSSALVCQLLNVHAIPRKLDSLLKSRSNDHPGWCEAFVNLMLQNKSLQLLSVTREEALRNDLIYPNPRLIMKIPKDLSPEDTTTEFPWIRGKGNVTICLTSEKFTGDVDSFLDVSEIHREIYERSRSYDKKLLQCAATLGNVFARNALQNIMPNPKAPETARAVTRMINMRILECASIQRHQVLPSDDTTWCMYKNRTTFSDMHHLVQCSCTHSGDWFSHVKVFKNVGRSKSPCDEISPDKIPLDKISC